MDISHWVVSGALPEKVRRCNYLGLHRRPLGIITNVRNYIRGKFLFSTPQDKCKEKAGTDMGKAWDYNWVPFLIVPSDLTVGTSMVIQQRERVRERETQLSFTCF